MGLSDYINKDTALAVGEDMAKMVVEKLVFPAVHKYVNETSNVYDNAAFEMVKAIIMGALDNIHQPQSQDGAAPAPATP